MGALLLKQAPPPLHEPAATEPVLPAHASTPTQEFAAMDAELSVQAFERLQELAATEPLLPSHARNWLQEFAAMDAELSVQASWSLQEPAATVPLLPLQASVPVHLGAGAAFAIPADPTITRIPQSAAAISHIRLFMLDPPGPYLTGISIFESRLRFA